MKPQLWEGLKHDSHASNWFHPSLTQYESSHAAQRLHLTALLDYKLTWLYKPSKGIVLFVISMNLFSQPTRLSFIPSAFRWARMESAWTQMKRLRFARVVLWASVCVTVTFALRTARAL